MRYIISLALLLMLAWAVNISVEPTYARIPVNSSLSLTISITGGEGKLYRVEVFGPYVSWTSQNVWIGPQGKKLTVDFEPESPGQYSISVKVDSVSATATVDVFQPQTREDLRERIEELRKRVKTDEERAMLEEVERLYNESRYELAEMRMNELEKMLTENGEKSAIFHIGILLVLLLFAFFLIRLLPV